MKKKKRIVLFVVAFVLIVILFNAYCIYLSDRDINGYVGMKGIVTLRTSDAIFARLTDDPLQLLIKQSDLEPFLTQYFDKVDKLYYQGFGEVGGVRYFFMPGHLPVITLLLPLKSAL